MAGVAAALSAVTAAAAIASIATGRGLRRGVVAVPCAAVVVGGAFLQEQKCQLLELS